jgi:GYF domain 2
VNDYFIAVDGKPAGPYPASDLAQRLSTGTLDPATLCWQEGMAEWAPVATRLPAPNRPVADRPPQWTEFSGAGAVPTTPGMLASPSQEQYFVHISPARLIVMSILSFGLFEWWWFFKNWRYVRTQDRSNIMPFWRAFFIIFHTHALMRRIRADHEPGVTEAHAFSPNAMAWGFIASVLISNALGNMDGLGPAIFAAWVPSYLFLLPAQTYVNAIVRARTPSRGDYPWSFGQGLCVAFGVTVWLLLIVGVLSGTEV